MPYFTLITGASAGIGKAMAYQFAEKGHHLILVARRKDALEELKKEIEVRYSITAHVFSIDLTEAGAPEELFKQVTAASLSINILINNAGMGLYDEFLSLPLKDQGNLMHLNMISLVELTHLFANRMVQDKISGSIINVSSITAFFSSPRYTLYNASKAFVLSFSEGLAMDLEKKNIVVLALCPGPTSTRIHSRAMNIKDDKIPQGVFYMTPEQVAQIAYRAYVRNLRVQSFS